MAREKALQQRVESEAPKTTGLLPQVAQKKLADRSNTDLEAPPISGLRANFVGVPVQRKGDGETPSPNRTGLPDRLKTGIEYLSGMSLSEVRVHYNSPKPAQLQAHAYTQGTNIHVAPGQEKHLPHEAWHVVQQKQGRVRPTIQMRGNTNINDAAALEREADVMGTKSLQFKENKTNTALKNSPIASSMVQRKFASDVKIRTVDHLTAQYPEEMKGLNYRQRRAVFNMLDRAPQEYKADEIAAAILEAKPTVKAAPVKSTPNIKAISTVKAAPVKSAPVKPTSTVKSTPPVKPTSTVKAAPVKSAPVKSTSNIKATSAKVAPIVKAVASSEKEESQHGPGQHNIESSGNAFPKRPFLIPKTLKIKNLFRGDSRSREELAKDGFKPGERVKGYLEKLKAFLTSMDDTKASEDASQAMKNREKNVAILNPDEKRHKQIDLVWSRQKIEVSGGRTITLLNYVCTGPDSGAGGSDYLIKVEEDFECISASPTLGLYQSTSSDMQILAMASSAGEPGSYPKFHEYDFLTSIPPERIFYASKDNGKTQETRGDSSCSWFHVDDKSPR